MEHTLTIESDEAAALASELAELTGQSVPAAVTAALRACVDRERRTRPELDRQIADVLAIAAEIRAHCRGPLTNVSTDELYDEQGVPA